MIRSRMAALYAEAIEFVDSLRSAGLDDQNLKLEDVLKAIIKKTDLPAH